MAFKDIGKKGAGKAGHPANPTKSSAEKSAKPAKKK